MAMTDLKIFEKYVYTTMTEVERQQIDLFNAQTRGAITLRPKANDGDFASIVKYALIPNLVARRNAYAQTAVTAQDVKQINERSVKVAARAGPVGIDPRYFTWQQYSQEEYATVIGQQLAVARIRDYLNTAISAATAGLAGTAAVFSDISAATPPTMTLAGLLSGARKFGDRAQDVRVWVTHSKVLHDLYGASIANAGTLFKFDTIWIRDDGFGRIIIMTDSPSLVVAGTPGKYYTIGLTEEGLIVEDNGDFFLNVEVSNRQDNIDRTYQAEWTFNVGLKGFQWNTAGGKSPTAAAIGTAANWVRVATSEKDLAGVCVLSQ